MPRGTTRGDAVNKNCQRLRAAAASLNGSRSQLSNMGMPMATTKSWCIGYGIPGTGEGMSSACTSLPITAISRCLNQRAQETWSPADA